MFYKWEKGGYGGFNSRQPLIRFGQIVYLCMPSRGRQADLLLVRNRDGPRRLHFHSTPNKLYFVIVTPCVRFGMRVVHAETRRLVEIKGINAIEAKKCVLSSLEDLKLKVSGRETDL